MTLHVLVCGSGSGGHVLSAVISSCKNVECRVLSLTQAERWNNALENTSITCSFPKENAESLECMSRPLIISSNPARVVPDADVILLSIPALFHDKYLKVIQPFILKPTIIVGLPGQQGFQFQVHAILNDKLPYLTILSVESLPWVCRITKFGTKVNVAWIKDSVKVAVVKNNVGSIIDPLQTLQSLLGQRPVFEEVKHYLELSPMFAAQHVGIMYGMWKNWDGIPLQKRPLFYQGADEAQSYYLSNMKDELDMMMTKMADKGIDLDLRGWETGFKWLIKGYGSAIEERNSLQMALVSNKAYDGLNHPMKEVADGFVPDFSTRYLTEDVPFTLVVLKGLAELVGQETPILDALIKWGQDKLGKEYITESLLQGKDLHETRAPQVYGINSLEELKNFDKNLSFDCLLEK